MSRPPLVRRIVVLAAVVATAAQLAAPAWRLMGGTGGYTASEDERLYVAAVRNAARAPLDHPNPFDGPWAGAAASNARLLVLLAAVPVRLGAPAGAVWDAARWLGSFLGAGAAALAGAAVATPAVGAAASVVLLLDPGVFAGKPLVSLAGIGTHAGDDPHQILMSRSLVPAVTLPLLLLALLGVMAAARRGRAARGAVMIGAVGLSGNLFTWSAALAGAGFTALAHPRRRRLLLPVSIGLVAAVALVALGGHGRQGSPLTEAVMRVGGIRTHRPQILLHAGFWLGALAAAALLWLPWRVRSAARTLGAVTLGAWLFAMLQTPLTGWDLEGFHFGYALGPLMTLCWFALAWHAWRRHGRPIAAVWAATALVCAVGAIGPVRALRGLGNAIADGRMRHDEARLLLARAGIPERAVVAVPADLASQFGASYDGVVFGSPWQAWWSVPDTVLFDRAVCAAALTGADSAGIRRLALRRRPGDLPEWHYGRPADVALPARDYSALFGTLADRLAAALAEAGRSAEVLAARCSVRPRYALAMGALQVARAEAAGQSLGGRPRWRDAHGRAAWMEFAP